MRYITGLATHLLYRVNLSYYSRKAIISFALLTIRLVIINLITFVIVTASWPNWGNK